MLLGWFKRLLFRLLFLAVGLVLVLGYLGFVPGVSNLFHSNQPTDLGHPVSDYDRTSANAKLQQTFVDAKHLENAIHTLPQSAPHQLNVKLSPEEAAAHLMEIHPVSDLQLRFNADNTFDASGRIDTKRIEPFLKAYGLTKAQVEILSTIDSYFPGSPRITLSGRGSITNDVANLELTDVHLGRIPLSPGAFAKGIAAYANTLMKNVPGLDPERVTITDSQVEFQGQAPAVLPLY